MIDFKFIFFVYIIYNMYIIFKIYFKLFVKEKLLYFERYVRLLMKYILYKWNIWNID